MTIDYSKLNDQVVRQAWDASTAFLTEAQRQKLFQNKIDRAAAMIRAQEQFQKLAKQEYISLEDWFLKVVAGNEGLCYTITKHKRAACRMKHFL